MRVQVGFEVLEVKRDGRSEPYALESLSNGERIRIGDKDVFLDTGTTPTRSPIARRASSASSTTYDELYWNVTGNGWTFPIEQATAIIRLPPGAQIQTACCLYRTSRRQRQLMSRC